jgi:hypothetical protein
LFARGSIFVAENFVFSDGAKGKKLLILLISRDEHFKEVKGLKLERWYNGRQNKLKEAA